MEQKDFLSLGALQEKQKRIIVYFIEQVRIFNPQSLNYNLNYCAPIFLLQNLSGDPVLLSSIERFGVEHDVGAVARLGAGYVALPTELHPWHGQNRPGTDRLRSVRQKVKMTQ